MIVSELEVKTDLMDITRVESYRMQFLKGTGSALRLAHQLWMFDNSIKLVKSHLDKPYRDGRANKMLKAPDSTRAW